MNLIGQISMVGWKGGLELYSNLRREFGDYLVSKFPEYLRELQKEGISVEPPYLAWADYARHLNEKVNLNSLERPILRGIIEAGSVAVLRDEDRSRLTLKLKKSPNGIKRKLIHTPTKTNSDLAFDVNEVLDYLI